MTRRERLEAKAQRRLDWAASAEQKSERAFDGARRLADAIPLGQPILVGHHSERRARRDQDRIHNGMRKGCELADLAKHHASRADGLARQLETAVYSDDDDAIEQLEARIRTNEEARDRIKAYNATCRAAAKAGRPLGNVSLLDEDQRKDLETLARVAAYQLRPGGAFPAYTTAYAGARIKTDRDRIEQIRREQSQRAEAEAAPNGVVIIRADGANWCNVRFAERPDRDILNALRSAGFHWAGGCWGGYADKLPEEVLELAGEPIEQVPPTETEARAYRLGYRAARLYGKAPNIQSPERNEPTAGELEFYAAGAEAGLRARGER